MTNEEAFKLGFFLKCAEEGMSPAQVQEHFSKIDLEKKAAIWDILAAPVNAAGSALGSVGGLLAAGGLALPPLAGYGLGWAAAKAQEEDITPEELKRQEIIAEYKRLAARARLGRKLKDLQEEGQIA